MADVETVGMVASGGWFQRGRRGRPRQRTLRVGCEALEGRSLMAASLTPIDPVVSAAGAGYQLELLGGTAPQTYTVTSNNPKITANVAQGQLSNTNPNGVLHIDTTQAVPGQSAILTVTATDPADGSTVTRPVQVFVPGANTGAVRLLNDVLIVTPKPRRTGRNQIQVFDFQGQTFAAVNGKVDAISPETDSLLRLVVYGSKAGDRILVNENLLVPATLDGGHGGLNRIQAGGAGSRLHGWFGWNVMRGGPEKDRLVGRMGKVKFRTSPGGDFYFLGEPRATVNYRNHKAVAPQGIVVQLPEPMSTSTSTRPKVRVARVGLI